MLFQRLIILLFSFLFYLSLKAQNYNACINNTPIHIVVLGSSTAAGSGPSSSDSAWVNRYRKHLQSINPLNTVTNLAIGGTTTYHILPDWFSATTKPTTNPSNNISQAIRLGADAVIINMPSNDAANGFGVNEQMANFNMIKSVADSFNVKLWVCTTQPKNFSAAKKQIQIGVRDSVLTQFGNFAIDFWSTIADTSNGIKGIYDSGDGTHLNNRAHGILNDRVINKLIPNQLIDTLNHLDLTIDLLVDLNACGDSSDLITAVVSNLGVATLSNISVKFEIINTLNTQTYTSTRTIVNGLSSCTSDTIQMTINTYSGGNFKIRAYLDVLDSNATNDTTDYLNIYRSVTPVITSSNNYYCKNDSATLFATSSIANTIVWYNSVNSMNPIYIGDTFDFFPIKPKTDFYAQAVSGPLHNKEVFDLTQLTTTNWNGYMFNIIPNDTITIDSIEFPISSLGNQKVVAYYRYGNYIGFEDSITSWTYWGIDSATITSAGQLAQLNYSDLQITPNDTFAIYFHLQNSTSNLSYKSTGTVSIFSDSRLAITSGSGVSYTFGSTYYPRNFAGKIHYHHGFNPEGECQSARIKVSAIENQPYLNLGNDTSISILDSIYLNATNFNYHFWSTGDTTAQILLKGSILGIGNHTITLDAVDSLGCTNKDTLEITIRLPTNLSNQNDVKTIKVYPNPSSDFVTFDFDQLLQLKIFNSQGKEVKFNEELHPNPFILDVSKFLKGVYIFQILDKNQNIYHGKLIIK